MELKSVECYVIRVEYKHLSPRDESVFVLPNTSIEKVMERARHLFPDATYYVLKNKFPVVSSGMVLNQSDSCHFSDEK
jgi:hypothetical protein